MSAVFITCRYAVFAVFTICSAITCSVSVWNYTLGRDASLNLPVDIFLAFLGALGVVFIIPVLFLDIFRRNALPTRVWFEIAWVAIFWMMYLAGASAATSMLPDLMCSPLAPLLPGYSTHSCVSSNVLLAFTWMCMSTLLLYLVALVVSAVLHHDDDAGVWKSSVRFFPWYATRSTIPSAPSSPKSWQRPFALVVPQPKHAVDHFETVKQMDAAADVEATMAPATRKVPMRQNARTAVTQPEPAASMYPPHVQNRLPAGMGAAPAPTGNTPPPLGDWPRSMQDQRQPRSTRKPAPSPEATQPPATSPRSSSSRRGSPTRRRTPPPPLDLSRISAYNRVEEAVVEQERRNR